jgi:hypothetical protein
VLNVNEEDFALAHLGPCHRDDAARPLYSRWEIEPTRRRLGSEARRQRSARRDSTPLRFAHLPLATTNMAEVDAPIDADMPRDEKARPPAYIAPRPAAHEHRDPCEPPPTVLALPPVWPTYSAAEFFELQQQRSAIYLFAVRRRPSAPPWLNWLSERRPARRSGRTAWRRRRRGRRPFSQVRDGPSR